MLWEWSATVLVLLRVALRIGFGFAGIVVLAGVAVARRGNVSRRGS